MSATSSAIASSVAGSSSSKGSIVTAEPLAGPLRRPGAGEAPIDRDRRPHDAAAGDDLRDVKRVDGEVAALVAEVVVVIGAEQANDRSARAPARLAVGEQDLIPRPHLAQLGGDPLEAEPAVAQRQPGPAGEVALRGGAVGADVAAGELGERVLARAALELAEPVAGRHQAGLPAAVGAEAESALDRRQHPEVDLDLLGGVEAGLGEPRRELGPGQRSIGPDLPAQQVQGAVLRGAVEPEVRHPLSRLAGERVGEQRRQPAGILGGDQMSGAPHDPGTQQGALLAACAVDVGAGQRTAAGAKGELRGAWLLGLHRSRQSRHVRGVAHRCRPGEQLRAGAQDPERAGIDPASAQERPMARPSRRLTRGSPSTLRCP